MSRGVQMLKCKCGEIFPHYYAPIHSCKPKPFNFSKPENEMIEKMVDDVMGKKNDR